VDPATALLGPEWFRALAADWLRFLVRKRRKPSTVATYVTPLRHLGRWLEDEGVDDPNALNRQALDRWQDVLVHEVREKTHSVYAGAIRGLLRWASREGRLQPGLADYVESPEVPPHDPLVLARDQLAAVAERYRDHRRDLVYLRDRALFWFLVSSAARISEALQVDLVQLDRRRWIVRQKGGGEKALFISTVARAWLEQYLKARGKDEEAALWIYVGPLAGRRRLTRTDANRIWARLCRELGIERFTSRYLRGTAATELDELENTPIAIAKHLGHKNLASVMKYVQLRERRHQAMVDGLDHLVPPAAASTPRRRGRPRPPARSSGS